MITRKRLSKRIRQLIWECDTEITEIFLAMAMLVWGLIFLLPPFDVFEKAPAFYRVMALISPEYLWGLVMVILAVMKIYGVLSEHPTIRKNAAFAAISMWVIITASAFMSAPNSPSLLFLGIISITSGWIYFRISKGGKTT